MQVLRNSENLSTMKKLIQKSAFKTLLHRIKDVKNVCFSSDICMPVAGDLKKHFNNLLKVKQFTIQLLDDEIFDSMNKTKLNLLLTDRVARKDFLLQHVFLGILEHNNLSNSARMIATSAKNNHPIIEMSQNKNTPVVAHPDQSVYSIDKMIRVKEGLIQVLKKMK